MNGAEHAFLAAPFRRRKAHPGAHSCARRAASRRPALRRMLRAQGRPPRPSKPLRAAGGRARPSCVGSEASDNLEEALHRFRERLPRRQALVSYLGAQRGREVAVEERRHRWRTGSAGSGLRVPGCHLVRRGFDGFDDERLLAFEVAIEAADSETEVAHDAYMEGLGPAKIREMAYCQAGLARPMIGPCPNHRTTRAVTQQLMER
jgi:hypothetical protein